MNISEIMQINFLNECFLKCGGLSRGNMSRFKALCKQLDFVQLMFSLQQALVRYTLLPLNNADSHAARIFFKSPRSLI
jgi:hypothetical protein